MPTPPHSPPLDSPPLSPDKLPLKRQRRLRVEHFDFSGVDVDITDSDLDFGEAIEENNNESEDISEGEDWLIEIDSVDPLMTMQGEMSGSSEASKTGSVGDSTCVVSTQGSYPCDFGWNQGFTDNLGRAYHYAMQKCAYGTFPDYDYAGDRCAGPVDNGTSTRMQHWFRVHAPDAHANREMMFNNEGHAPKVVNRRMLLDLQTENLEEQDILRYVFHPASNISRRWPLYSANDLVSTGFLTTKKITQNWRDFGALLRTEVSTNYDVALHSNTVTHLEVELISDFDSMSHTPDAHTLTAHAPDAQAPRVSENAVARFRAFRRSCVVHSLGRDSTAKRATKDSARDKKAGCGFVCAFDLVQDSSVLFKQCSFQCPVPWCKVEFDATVILSNFLLHVEEPAHAQWLLGQEGTFACRFGCGLAFIAEYSRWRHEASQGCPLQPTDIDINRCRCPDEINPRCQEINSTNRRLLLSDYNRHYEHEHGRYEYENNSDAFKCHMCKMGFISKRLFVRHLIGSIRQEAKDLHQGSTLSISGFMHYRSLAREGLVWTIPQRYVQIKRLDKGNNLQDLSLPFPSRESLWHAFNGGEGGYHLIFFFRSSSRKGVTSTLEGRMRYVKRVVEFLRQTGRIYGHVSVVIIATEYTKAKLIPSLFGDLELEVTLIAADLPEMVYSKAMTKWLKTYATRAAAATVQVTAHILYAIMHSKNPLIVSIGANGLANNWRRFSLLMDRLSRQYGEVDVLVTMPAEEVECERGQCNSILICPEKYKGVYYGVYTSREIAEWGTGGENDAGVMAWKALQDGLQEKNDESARFWARYGGHRG
ncbi:hypothetical protein KCU92_g5323, partial [Aureobasidium melanogenum]